MHPSWIVVLVEKASYSQKIYICKCVCVCVCGEVTKGLLSDNKPKKKKSSSTPQAFCRVEGLWKMVTLFP